MIDVAGKVVVITGASRGLGAGMAAAMSQLGVRLGLCARSAFDADGDVVVRRADVTDRAALSDFAASVEERHGPIDLWINNAGVLDPVRFVRELDGAALMQHLAINVGGVLEGSRVFLQHLHAADRAGVLINISSGAALRGYAGWGAYCAGKAAVDRLTECIQLEERERVRAYAVAPGVIDTDMQATIRGLTEEQFPDREKFVRLYQNDAFNTPSFVARGLLDIAFDHSARPSNVVVRLPNEKAG